MFSYRLAVLNTTNITHHFSNAFNIALSLIVCILKVTYLTVFEFVRLFYHKYRLSFAKLNIFAMFQILYAIKMSVYKSEVNKLVSMVWLQNGLF